MSNTMVVLKPGTVVFAVLNDVALGRTVRKGAITSAAVGLGGTTYTIAGGFGPIKDDAIYHSSEEAFK